MKNLRDIANLYRTMVAEALAEFSREERGEWAGKWLDDRAFALSVSIRPRRPTTTSDWQNLGFAEEPTVADWWAAVEKPMVERARHLLDDVYGPAAPNAAQIVKVIFGDAEDPQG